MDKKKSLILFVSTQSIIGGAEKSLLLLATYIQKDYSVMAVVPRGTLARRLNVMEIGVSEIPEQPKGCFRLVRLIFYLIRCSIKVMKVAHINSVNIVHTNNSLAAVVSFPSVICGGRRLIWHCRDMIRSRALCRLCAFFSSKIIAVSNTVKQPLIKHGIKENKIEVIYNGIETKNNTPHHCKRIKGCSNNRALTFASIGQFVPWKRQELFLEAARKVSDGDFKAEFILIGDDIFGWNANYKNNLLSKLNKLDGAVRWLGWQQDMEKLWGEIDCLVHTAREEPFGRVIIEAMLHKVLVLASDSGGPAEIIQNGRTGLLLRTDNADELSGAIRMIATNKNLFSKIAAAGQEFVISQFSAEQTAAAVSRCYEKILVSD